MENKINNTNTNLKYFEDTVELNNINNELVKKSDIVIKDGKLTQTYIEYDDTFINETLIVEDELEYFGTEGLKQMRLKQRTYYNTKTDQISYFELFNYYKDNITSLEERSISIIYKLNNEINEEKNITNKKDIIAYRYYKDGNNNIQKDNYFTSVKKII